MGLSVMSVAAPAAAQGLGTFQWQMAPFCNVVTLTVVQQGSTYVLTGFDDQCGAGAARASAVGAAFVNPDGSVGMGLSIVTTGGAAAHVDINISLSGLAGTWQDGDGNGGPFLPNGVPAPGSSPRPAPIPGGAPGPGTVTTEALAPGAVTAAKLAPGAVGAAALNPAEVLTAVTAGVGLTGGGTSGSVGLDVAFAGSGSATTVARSDHRHTLPRVVIVAPSGGDFTSVAAALSSITDASPTNPYLVQVMPGVYAETALVQVGSFVHVRGSGPSTTVVTSSRTAGTPGAAAATVELLELSRLSHLTVRNTGAGTYGLAMFSESTTRGTVVESVTAEAIGAGGLAHYAAYWSDAEATIRDSTLFAGGAVGFGTAVNAAFGSVNISGGFPQALIERSILIGGSNNSLENCNDNSGTGFGLQMANSTPLVRHSYICGGHRGIGNKFTGAGTGLRCVHAYHLGTWAALSNGTTAGTACN
jgi:hypothetical protein